ncbi:MULTISPECIES: alpha/beta hydrolase [Commensalibacter]|uniref:Uncharacterized protein n=2 Tax=Commensalibacter TaxID=1079922 RepID=W7DXU0_9PROT|nr:MULTISPECIES: alpha/beta hydrolase [Commensalibacter]EUK19028.1 hypothetical protein COMX_04740 [Commensalibacter papalotli (ex Servin-Garciduenas et al. 2014)]CAI3923844.1 Predicted esterase of the alpha/beta hydrolase fold (YdeN) (PDB:1UXO) (PUBMED:15159570) [Commensalibacter papalotli (ex Botero et al. 2024)]CAI3928187.1 Predicted esterase of the alpha/beta hydrolase fold (YdeN) (PDB:1UXO) (PUBMED:15159570) [Commensalibacter papalotli (ex Botero et al. 2024)]
MNKQNFRNKNVVIVHGYAAPSQSHWFPWLKETLESQVAVVTIACMPNSSTPDPVE